MTPVRALAALALLASLAALAQAPGLQRRELQRAPLADGVHEVVLVQVEVAPGSASGRHRHPGVETGYVLAGETVLEVEGEPPRRLGPGDSYLIPAGRAHDVRATGTGPARALATFVVERGKPLATPAP